MNAYEIFTTQHNYNQIRVKMQETMNKVLQTITYDYLDSKLEFEKVHNNNSDYLWYPRESIRNV